MCGWGLTEASVGVERLGIHPSSGRCDSLARFEVVVWCGVALLKGSMVFAGSLHARAEGRLSESGVPLVHVWRSQQNTLAALCQVPLCILLLRTSTMDVFAATSYKISREKPMIGATALQFLISRIRVLINVSFDAVSREESAGLCRAGCGAKQQTWPAAAFQWTVGVKHCPASPWDFCDD